MDFIPGAPKPRSSPGKISDKQEWATSQPTRAWSPSLSLYSCQIAHSFVCLSLCHYLFFTGNTDDSALIGKSPAQSLYSMACQPVVFFFPAHAHPPATATCHASHRSWTSMGTRLSPAASCCWLGLQHKWGHKSASTQVGSQDGSQVGPQVGSEVEC